MIQLEENKSIEKLTTIGVKARTYRYCKIKETSSLFNLLKSNSLPIKILGGGSNVLWTKNFDGLTIHINTKGICIEKETDSYVIVNIQAGENWHEFVIWSIENGYGGIENLALIPGNVGAAPIQNIGAYGVELKEVFVECSAIDIKSLKFKVFSVEECQFGYRDSIFRNQEKNNYIITSIKVKLSKEGHYKLATKYGDIEKLVGKAPLSPSNIAQAVIDIRTSKLPDPKQIGNCGSFFKNPIIDEVLFKNLIKKYSEMPNYPSKDGYKIPAAWLIEKLNYKGYRVGDAGVHKKQALILVNYGNSSGSEILKLSNKISKEVYEVFGINLIPEVSIW